MEPYPPTLDVRFSKDQINEMVKDKYQLNAYLLGNIFSITKEKGDAPEDSSSDTSSESNLSIFESSEEGEEDQETSPKHFGSRKQKDRRFNKPLPRYQEFRDRK